MPFVAFPDFSEPFILCTDASALGLGGVLTQTDARGKRHIIAYASRVLNDDESRKSVTHLEALGVI